ncbi:hypothetical protein ACG2LH_09645 [Zhouia sp. PK063]|uniref:hypothetical protein n=1 Tax=Zhouia sp. PK063 TaxID=3373602 RepID=UPI0037BC6790
MKFLKFTEYLYVLVAIVSVIEIIALWNEDRTKAYMFVAFAVVSISMFFFRRHYRKKFDRYKNDQNQ